MQGTYSDNVPGMREMATQKIHPIHFRRSQKTANYRQNMQPTQTKQVLHLRRSQSVAQVTAELWPEEDKSDNFR